LTDRFVRSVVPDPSRSVVLTWDVAQPALVLAVYASGERSFRVYYRRGGAAECVTLPGSALSIPVADARRLAARIVVAVAEGGDPKAARRGGAKEISFAALHARYVAEWSSRRHRSWRKSAAIAERVLIPRWGRRPARSITRADCRAMFAAVGTPMAANGALDVASAIFSFGVAQEILDQNPCAGIARNQRRSRERTLSDREIALLWGDLDVAFKVILLTAQRPGEVFAMRAEDVDLAARVWRMPAEPTADGWCGTKNRRAHDAPLSDAAVALVREHLARPVKRRAAEARLSRLVRRRGIENLTPHDLRRTAATIAARAGVDRETLRALLNHVDASVTATYDRHRRLDEMRIAVDKIVRHVERVVSGVETDNVVRLR
jgi:integrase